MKNKIKMVIFRMKLLANGFFTNVTFLGKKTNLKLIKWLFNLYKYHDINFYRFEDLFCKYQKITFPITYNWYIKGGTIVDSLGNEFYFYFNEWEYYKMLEYKIGEEDKNFYNSCSFKILKNNEIIKDSMDVFSLKDNNKNKVTFNYNVETITTAKFAINDSNYNTVQKLYITYSSQGEEFDKHLAEYLYSLANNDMNDSFPIFSNVINMFKNKSMFISIRSEEKNKVKSEIVSTDGIITRYVFTVKKSDSLTCLYEHVLSKNIDDFLFEYREKQV